MTCTKRDLIKAVQRQNGYTEKDAAQIVNQVISEIKNSLEAGEDVLISGFGKFQVKTKDARNGRNPANGNSMTLRARKVVAFKWSGKLRDKLNG